MVTNTEEVGGWGVLCGRVTSFVLTGMDVTRPGTWDDMTHGKITTFVSSILMIHLLLFSDHSSWDLKGILAVHMSP